MKLTAAVLVASFATMRIFGSELKSRGSIVRLIVSAFGDVPDVTVLLFEPADGSSVRART